MPDYVIAFLLAIPILLLCIGIGLFIRALIEPYLLEVRHETIQFGKDPSGTPEKTILRIAFFSDLHGKGCKVSDQKLVQAIFSEPCDIILFGGDLTTNGRNLHLGISRLRQIAQKASALSIPCYAVRGNHDRFIPEKIFSESGFRLMVNSFSTVSGSSGQEFLLIGINDSGKKDRVWPSIPDRLPAKIPPERRIVLVHNPDYIYTQSDNSIYKIQLSGHLHGGQLYLPFGLEFRLLRGDEMPREGHVKGLFVKNGIVGYISRGCGCIFLPLRLFSRPEITHLHLVE